MKSKSNNVFVNIATNKKQCKWFAQLRRGPLWLGTINGTQREESEISSLSKILFEIRNIKL